MKDHANTSRFNRFFICFLFTVLVFGCDSGGSGDDPQPTETTELNEIEKSITEKNAAWTAGSNPISELSEPDRKLRLGVIPPSAEKVRRSSKENSQVLPATFDWGDSPVKDQGACASDWAFACIAALEYREMIDAGNTAVPDLSEQTVISCSVGSCDGGRIEEASEFLRLSGTYTETCRPYAATNGSCGNVCENGEAGTAHKIGGWEYVDNTLDGIKLAIHENGPVIAVFSVFTDFFYYRSGIYANVWGVNEGHHAVLVTGWNDSERYFRAKNSWGAGWGEAGHFRISYDELSTGTAFGEWTYAYTGNPVSESRPTANAGADQTAAPGDTVTLDGSGSTDPDGGIQSYLWSQVSGPAVPLSGQSEMTVSFIAPDSGETFVFNLTVTDGDGLSGTDSCRVAIESAYEPPVADAGPNQTVREGKTVVLDGSNSTGDGVISHSWTQISGREVAISDNTAASPTFVAPTAEANSEKLTFELRVTDGSGAVATDTCDIYVNKNRVPEAHAGYDRIVEPGETVTLDGSGSSDPDGDDLSYAWTQKSGTTVTLSDAASMRPSFTAPPTGENGETLTFSLTVSDYGGLTDIATTNVIVTATPVNVDNETCPGTCKLVLNVCSCPNACDFEAGWVIGVELRILTAGVYWAEDSNTPAFADAGTNCYQGDYELNFSRYPNANAACLATQHTDTFKVAYFDGDGNRVPGPGSQIANRAKIIRTIAPFDGYELTTADISGQLCAFWIDVPAMQADPWEITPGSLVVLRMSMLTAEPLNGSAGCTAPDYLRPVTPAAPPACQADNGGIMGNGECAWTWDRMFCPDCADSCYCDKVLGVLGCCSKRVAMTNKLKIE